jgi:hypothetical protein
MGINDFGTVVGTYLDNKLNVLHGFIFHNGHWATLDYPHAPRTFLVGITNTGKILGNAFFPATPSNKPFLYENGTFKVISVPNANPATQNVTSISPKQGLIVGLTGPLDTGNPEFIAQCE